MERRLHEIRITRVNRRAAQQRQMRERSSTIILQRTKQRIGVDLVARTIQEAAAVIAANVTVSAQMPAQIAAELPLIVLLVTCTPPEEISPPAPPAELPLIVLFTILRLP